MKIKKIMRCLSILLLGTLLTIPSVSVVNAKGHESLATPNNAPSRIYVKEPSHDRGEVAYFRVQYYGREYHGYLQKDWGMLGEFPSGKAMIYEYSGYVYPINSPIPAPLSVKNFADK